MLKMFIFKGLPGCFFTRTSLLKSSNNIEPMCNNVKIKSPWLIISNKLIYGMRDTYYKWEPQKLESNHISNTLVFNDL